MKLYYDEQHSNFAFNFNLRHYSKLDDLVKIMPTLREAAALDDTTEIPVDLLRHVDEAGPDTATPFHLCYAWCGTQFAVD